MPDEEKKEEVEQPKDTPQPVELHKQETAEEEKKDEDPKDNVKIEEKKVVVRPFDPELDGKNWDSIDLGSMLMQNNKKRNMKEGKKTIVKVTPSELVRVRNDVNLKLTDEITFSMTHFAKPNKGFSNVQQINCFMNVCL